MLGEAGSDLLKAAHDTANQLVALTRELEDRDGPRKETTRARATGYAVLGDIDNAIGTWKEFQTMDGVQTSDLADARYYARFLAEALGEPRDVFDHAFPSLQLVVFAGHLPDREDRLESAGRFPLEMIPRVSQAIADELNKRDVRVGLVVRRRPLADLLFIEAMLARKGTVHVVLPWQRDEFLRTSVRRYEPKGKEPIWERKFEHAMEHAATVRELGQAYVPKSDVGWSYMMEVTAGMGNAAPVRTSRLEVQPMVLWDRQTTRGNRGTSYVYEFWRHLLKNDPVVIPMPQSETGTRPFTRPGEAYRCEQSTMHQEVKSMLFADIVGYSKSSVRS